MASMNDLILRAAGRRAGVVDRLAGARFDGDRQQRFGEAFAAVERAIKAGDEIAREQAEEVLDQVLEEARAARTKGTDASGASEDVPVGSGFDGGFRGRRPVAPARGGHAETAGQLFARAMAASLAERRAQSNAE